MKTRFVIDRTAVFAFLTVLILAGIYVSVYIYERTLILDDSYISYRYARNLAMGDGLSWNPGGPHVEGYTNFSLILVLAPFIKAGFDPLVVTRVISVIASLGISVVFMFMAARWFGMSKMLSFILGISYLAIAQTFKQALPGLETLLFVFLMTLAFWFASCYIKESSKSRHLIFYSAFQLLAFLTRPDGIILFASLVPWLIISFRSDLRKMITAGLILFGMLVLPIVTYLAWKFWYFGDIMPTSYYLKVISNGVVSAKGSWDVFDFLINIARNISILALLSLFVARDKGVERSVAFTFIIAYSIFYSRVDTLMNVHNRFMYPISPFLFYLAMPTLCAMYKLLLNKKFNPVVSVGSSLLVLFMVFFSKPAESIKTVVAVLKGNVPKEIAYKGYNLAKSLSKYPRIKDISIVVGDTGVVPYFTDATTIDPVGLTDKTICGEQDVDKILKYIVSRKPTLVFFPTNYDLSLNTNSHGRLGDMREWVNNPIIKWDAYRYVGTVFYQMGSVHLLLLKEYEHHDEFVTFMRSNVVEQIYSRLPHVNLVTY